MGSSRDVGDTLKWLGKLSPFCINPDSERGLIIRQVDSVFQPEVVMAIMRRVSRRGLNFDSNASQYGARNSAISFVFTRQMNRVPVLVRSREFTFLTTARARLEDSAASGTATIDPRNVEGPLYLAEDSDLQRARGIDDGPSLARRI